MGFLDNKGLKKVVNWLKDYVDANTISEGNILPVLTQVSEEAAAAKDAAENAKDEADKKQPSWVNDDSYQSAKNITLPNGAVVTAIVIPPYTVVRNYHRRGSSPVHIAFANLDGEVSLLPFPEMEYSLYNVYPSYFIWPAQADLPWPSDVNPGELPSVDHYLYIQAGRVLNYGPDESYCSSTYYVDIPESAVGQTFKLLNSSTGGTFVKVLIDGVEVSSKSSFSTPGPHSVTTLYHSNFVLTLDEMPICQFITSIDLSQHNPSAPIHLSGFSCPSIIWPANFALRPVNYLKFGLNADSLDLSDFKYLSLTFAGELSFGDGYIGRIEGETFLPPPVYINSAYQGTISFDRNTSPNTVLRQLGNAATARGWVIDGEGFSECPTLEQAGSVNTPWLRRTGTTFKSCGALKFASIIHDNAAAYFDFRCFQGCGNLREAIINSHPGKDISVSSDYYYGNTLLRLDTLVFNCHVSNFDDSLSKAFDPVYPTKVYIPTDWEPAVAGRLQEYMPLSWTLYKYESLDEIPFQYAPLD